MKMLVTVGIRKPAEGEIRIEVQRPQHPARVGKGCSSVKAARRVLSEFGISDDAIEQLLNCCSRVAGVPSHPLTKGAQRTID